jgi:hypothetical protein
MMNDENLLYVDDASGTQLLSELGDLLYDE